MTRIIIPSTKIENISIIKNNNNSKRKDNDDINHKSNRMLLAMITKIRISVKITERYNSNNINGNNRASQEQF